MKYKLGRNESEIPEDLIEKITILYISLNEVITELPFIPNLKKLDCRYCNRLTVLPSMPQLEVLDCRNCLGLTELPFMPNLETLYCGYCLGLTGLPSMPNLIELYCRHCTGLTELPSMPNLRGLECEGCIGLGVIEDYKGSGWTVLKFHDMLKISCEIHSIKEWSEFSDERINKMHGNALSFWRKNREDLLNLK